MGRGKQFDLSAMMGTMAGLEPQGERDIESVTAEILRLKQEAHVDDDVIVGVVQIDLFQELSQPPHRPGVLHR